MTDTFLVFDTTDRFHSGAICHGADEAKDFIAGLKDRAGLRVLRITEGELCRDLSDCFLAEEAGEPEEVEITNSTWSRHIRSFSRPSGY